MVPVVHPSKDALILVDSLDRRCYYIHILNNKGHTMTAELGDKLVGYVCVFGLGFITCMLAFGL
jgi:hypothetical protein